MQSDPNTPNPPSELEHINQELYKKGAELSEKNKTLLILRKIDEIILSSVTQQDQIAKSVTSLLVHEASFQLVGIFMLDLEKQNLNKVSISEYGTTDNPVAAYSEIKIPVYQRENPIAQAVHEKKVVILNNIDRVMQNISTNKDAIKCVFIYPLVSRNETIGAMLIAINQAQNDISAYTGDLLDRLVQVVGIAMDNALLYSELQDANEKLKALDKLKDEFVSLASHELRTPMTAIKSYLWMTQQPKTGPLNVDQKLYIDRAYISVERLIKLVNDMLNISRIESGRLTVEMQKVDLLKTTQEVVEDVKARAAEVGVDVVIVPPPNLSPVIADSDKIKEILFNLIGNSLKFTQKGGHITVSFVQNGDMVQVMVRDTGAGISQENIGKLFQKFAMLPESYALNQTAAGTGLGLYICRCIIEIHRGKIWAASDGEGKGSTFSFTLKVFNEKDFEEMSRGNATDKKPQLGIVHTDI